MTAIAPTWVSPCGRATLYLGDCLEVLPHIKRRIIEAIETYDGPLFEAAKKDENLF